MKNFLKLSLFSAVLMLALTTSQAQLRTLTISAADDTLTNTQTGYAKLQSNGTAQVISFQIKLSRVSGTMAGTATLEGSHDGVTYAKLKDSTYTFVNAASGSAIPWVVAPASVPYYRIVFNSTGTGVIAPTATAVIRK